MKPIKIGKYYISWKFILILAFVLFLVYMKFKSGAETVGPANILDMLGLK